MPRTRNVKTNKITGNDAGKTNLPGADARAALIRAKAAAKSQVKRANAKVIEAKGQRAKDKTALKRTQARARAFTASATALAAARAEVAKTRAKEQANLTTALDKWNSVINATSSPAEGTGEAKTGETATNKSNTGSTGGNPLGISGN